MPEQFEELVGGVISRMAKIYVSSGTYSGTSANNTERPRFKHDTNSGCVISTVSDL